MIFKNKITGIKVKASHAAGNKSVHMVIHSIPKGKKLPYKKGHKTITSLAYFNANYILVKS